jgi:anti-anti-sigma regulatory factor
MLFQITERLSEVIFKQIEETPDTKIEIDVSKIRFLTSKELSRLLICNQKKGKQIFLLHPNDHIRETIAVLGFESIFILKE